MTKRPFSTRPSYIQYVRGLHRLHELIAADQDDTPEADAVRDGMDHPWYELSEVERKRIRGLSADLYSISEPSEPIRERNPQAQRKLVEVFEARRAGEWDKALDLLRRWERYLEPALLSYLRGTVWEGAGDHATANIFFKHANFLEPQDSNYLTQYLFSLTICDPEAALVRAREILSKIEEHPPGVVVQASGIEYRGTKGMLHSDALPVIQRLTTILERNLERLQNEEARQSPTFRIDYIMTTHLLGSCYDRLGDFRKALHYFNLGLEADPEERELLVARGILRYGMEPGAEKDFEKAINYGFGRILPFFYLSHYHLASNRFDDCRRMCERALDFPSNDEIRGNLFEWLAISRAELRYPPEQVRPAFEEAVRLAPDNERIRRNFDLFEKAATQHAWEMARESQAKALGQAEFRPAA